MFCGFGLMPSVVRDDDVALAAAIFPDASPSQAVGEHLFIDPSEELPDPAGSILRATKRPPKPPPAPRWNGPNTLSSTSSAVPLVLLVLSVERSSTAARSGSDNHHNSAVSYLNRAFRYTCPAKIPSEGRQALRARAASASRLDQRGGEVERSHPTGSRNLT